MSAAVPIVDFQQYGLHLTNPKSVNSSLLEKTAKDLYHAFSSTGVCYIINHGVSQSMVDEVFKLSKSFFSLPVGEKQKYARGNGITYQSGWVCTGREHLDTNTGLGDIKESFDVIPVNVKWPTTIPEFQSTYLRFFDTCKQLTERVLDVLSIGLKLEDRNFLRSCHRLIGQIGNQTAMRSLYYPEVPTDGSVKPGQVRCGEHSDYGTVTLLFQDDVGGLEVHNTDGEYVPATPIPGAVVVNIGDLMQQWTSDKLIATKHRVLIPEEELKKKQCRQSIAFFINPDDDTIIKCLNGSDKYKPVSSYDYLSNKITASY